MTTSDWRKIISEAGEKAKLTSNPGDAGQQRSQIAKVATQQKYSMWLAADALAALSMVVDQVRETHIANADTSFQNDEAKISIHMIRSGVPETLAVIFRLSERQFHAPFIEMNILSPNLGANEPVETFPMNELSVDKICNVVAKKIASFIENPERSA